MTNGKEASDKQRVVSVLIGDTDKDYLEFKPNGYSSRIALPVIRSGSRDKTGAWTWNGSTDKPTLKPSIRTKHGDGTISHIWLTDGICQHLADSTDGFADKVLPLQELTP